MRVALNCYGDIPTGLGSEARWLWNTLPLDAWLQVEHPKLGWGEAPARGPVLRSWAPPDVSSLADCVVSVERVMPLGLAKQVKPARLVVLANPEWMGTNADFVGHADVVVARTDQALAHLQGLGIPAVRRQVPLDLREFLFRERERVERVVFTNGWGGVHDRKGWPEVQRLLRLAPGSVEVYSQRPLGGVAHHGAQPAGVSLYTTADLVLVPSRFEGIGLTILEAMASGCLVAATDADPMREFLNAAYGPHAQDLLLPVERTSRVSIAGQPWTAHHASPPGMLEIIRHARAMDADLVGELSRRGRAYVEREHGAEAGRRLWGTIIGGDAA